MKTVKTIVAVLLCIILMVAECTVMGLLAMDESLARGTVQEAVHETDFAAELANEVLSEATVNMGGEYGELVEVVMKTQAMEEFFADYIDNAIRHEIYGDEYREVSTDELMAAFSKGMDEAEKAGKVNMSQTEGELIRQAMLKQVPDMTADLNELIRSYDSTGGDMVEAAADPYDGLAAVTGRGSRAAALTVCVLVCAALIAIMWRSKLGFVWCGAVTALVSVIFWGLGSVDGNLLMETVSDTAAEEMLMHMVSRGFENVAAVGSIAAAAFFIAFIVLRIRYRRKKNESDTASAERIA